jgi:hypothetical protein
MAVGVLLALAGLVFILQGMGVVGPDYSFMFQNQTWIYQGAAVVVIGLVTLATGIFLSRRRQTAGSQTLG